MGLHWGVWLGLRIAGGAGMGAAVFAMGYATWYSLQPAPGIPGADIPASRTQAAFAPEPETAPTPPGDTTPPADPSPSFDIVRIDPDGSALVAGRAAPEARVSILLGEVEVGAVTADAQGAFFSLVQVAPAEVARTLTLSARQADGLATASAQTVIVSPAPHPAEEPAAPVRELAVLPPDAPESVGRQADATATALAAPVDNPAGPAQLAAVPPGPLPPPMSPSPAPVVTAQTAAPDVTRAPSAGAPADPAAPLAGAPAQPAAPRVMIADASGLRVLQSPTPAPRAVQSVVIDSISYDTEGEVVLAGRGTGSGQVRVYLDNQPVRDVPIAPDGQWRIDMPRVEAQVYTLRLDEIAEDGSVRSRAETPFKPEEADVIAAIAQGADSGAPISAITVQPGFTLWRIARENYGDGTLFVRVFEANADKIRDPDLIYPGQVFSVPE